MKAKWTIAATILFAAFLGLAGCEGDDGKDGAPGVGTDGDDGISCWDLNGNGIADPEEDINGDGVVDALDCQGPGVVTLPLETCAVCHGDNAFASATAGHAIDAQELVSGATAAISGADLVIDFTLEVDGVPTAGYNEITRFLRSEGLGTPAADISDSATLTDNGSGDYTITIAGGAAVLADSRYLFRVRIAEVGSSTQVYGWVDFPASPFAPAVVSAESCANCHGPEGIDVHGGYFAAEDGAEPCFVCHGASDYRGGPVASLGEATHEYHSGIWEGGNEITYPTYMTNCRVCHDNDATLTAANGMPVTAAGCFSCHGSIATIFPPDADPPSVWAPIHVGRTSCAGCHLAEGEIGGSVLTVADAHNGLSTERSGLIWNGEDVAVTEGENFTWTIDSIVDDGTELAISWTATYNTVAVDPCNATVGVDAPVFHVPGGGSGGTFSMLRSYAQGDDFIIGTSTSAPGQADAVNLSADNTTCSGLVATTIIPVDDVDATVGRVALQGKPGVVSPAGGLLRVRVPTPTFDWQLGSGDPAPDRRAVVNTEACLKCHVGSLYQHGGNRVDNVDMCILCHNSASNEQSVRVGLGVDPSEAYDGQVGETFEMKTMLHRVHSAGTAEIGGSATSPLYVIYRNRGIYAWAPNESYLPDTWPGTGDQIVFGSDFDTDGNPGDAVINHNFHAPTYPRSLNDCAACHTAPNFKVIPDQTQAMATTVDAGSTAWGNQLDDTLQGAATTACITCHSGGPAKGHSYQNSWVPQVFPEGRETIIEAVR